VTEEIKTDLNVLCTAKELAAVTGGTLTLGDPQISCSAVTTDSRDPLSDSLFVALQGPNFDGARFCRQAAASGSRLFLVAQTAWKDGLVGDLPSSCAVVLVTDTQKALGDLAAWHRRRFSARVIAVTGSNGKTSTRELITAVLGGKPSVLANQGNYNNLVGMPRALLGLSNQHRYAVMEMGMNAPGEIARLAEVAGPEVGVITNVHPVHLEGLGSLSAVAEAKGELFASLPPSGTAVLNADDPYLLKQVARTKARQVMFGRSPKADVRILDVRIIASGVEVDMNLAGNNITTRLRTIGSHNAQNAAAAAAVGLIENITPAEISSRLEQVTFPGMRLEHVNLGEAHLLVDCYNANPQSMQAGLQALSDAAGSGNKLAVLGEMRELGAQSRELHRQVGRYAMEAGLQGLCTFGPMARLIAAEARLAGLSDVFETEEPEEAVTWLLERLTPNCWVLLKGSRALRLERVAALLTQRLGVSWKASFGGHE
jgi:UDP-N-acetylmuramoyl-tripeptide--D-alanyl-D-alanine ligase